MDLNVRFSFAPSAGLMALGGELLYTMKGILMNQQEQTQKLEAIGAALTTVGAQLSKALGEVTAGIQILKDQIASAGQSTPEMDAAFANIESKLTAVAAVSQTLDDLHQDAPV